jgi:hypothetical protein
MSTSTSLMVRLDGRVVWSSDAVPAASIAAALEGTTTIVNFAMQGPGHGTVLVDDGRYVGPPSGTGSFVPGAAR